MQMKKLVGLAIAAALTGGVAHAAITNPGNNTGEIFEVVVDDTNGQVYARGLQISFSTVLPAVQSTTSYPTGTPPIPTGFTFTPVAADNNLTTFLGQDSGKDTFSFAVLGGGQNLGGAATPLGPNKPGGNVLEFTSTGTIAGGSLNVMPSTTLASALGSLKTDVTTLNGIIGGTAGDGTSANVSAQFNGNTSTMFELYGTNNPTLDNLGQKMNLYAMTGNGTAAGASQVYTGGLITMTAAGTLEAAQTVPLPGAVWLLGSGLLGLMGIGRRRLSA